MLLRGLFILGLPIFASADLRMASRPKDSYYLQNQGTTPWQLGPEGHARYMEPSTFKYKGLEKQKSRNYDNFLRSNVDNEQDNRHFENEDGKDHLPFRTYETAVFDAYEIEQTGRERISQIPRNISLSRSLEPGESIAVPIRWNNPHASEMEVNIWIFEHADKKPIVVPIRKPSCSAEGHQDNIIEFTVPSDFGTLGSKIPGFKGCKKESKPMCVLQIYAHSVESRTYAIGFPIMVSGHDTSATTTSTNAIAKASEDPGLDLSKLRDLCLDATDPSATITSSTPRWARLVSDVYNHAYQNSDYSPYSGQQHEAISKNIQASAINKMVTGNRGELGKSILPRDTSRKLHELSKLEGKVYKEYEAIANKIIQKMNAKMHSTGKIGSQNLANCFRCKEVGSTTSKRQQTNTYIPSFQLPQVLIAEAKTYVPEGFESLITDSGVVQIYVAAMNDLLPYFEKSRHLGVTYQAPVVKSTMTTMADAKNFKKRNEKNKVDDGKYAALEAKKQFVADRGCPSKCLYAEKPTQTDSTGCKWESHVGKYSRGNMGRRHTLDVAKKECVKNHQCHAITCGRPDTCQMRRSPADDLKDSPSAETTYTTSFSCINGFPEGSIEKPLVPDSLATKVSDECASCEQFFAKMVKSAPPTPQDKIINSGQDPDSGVNVAPPNPDDKKAPPSFIQEEDSSKSTSRTSFVRKARGKRRSALSVDASANVAPLP